MRVLVQRVKKATVTINGECYSAIGPGLLVFLGIEEADSGDDIGWLAAKVINLRLFDNNSGVMNLSAADTGKEIMIVSQFTLHASCLLYTSDAADDLLCVDLGGRRIIKKK